VADGSILLSQQRKRLSSDHRPARGRSGRRKM